MEIRQLRYFIAVADTLNFSRAAESVYLSQSALSRQIMDLEKEVGLPLLRRSTRQVELTEAGRSLYQQSQHMFQNFRMMVDSVRDVDAGVRGLLKVGVVYSNTPVVLNYLKAYHKEYPQVELYIRVGAPGDLLDDLNKGNLHVLFLRTPTEGSSDFHEKILGEDPLELVMCPELDPAPDQDSIPIELLKDVPMCLLRSDDLWGYSSHLINECQRKGFTPNTVCQCYDTPMTMQLVQAGFGISYLPRSIVETHPGSNIYSKPLVGLPAKSYPTLLWSSNIYYANCVKRFISMFGYPT